ncbi:type VI secretion system-associated protein VasI [Obesumbacterium proteus]|uniref:type VI secretion system-associated protein VasI n=1 Tax=Obesumbacterium proteus TaxID=82983 RepID=UPI002431BD07|nr:type VI secretion system-associated protein VasI [Obesumbacterium proteus]
MKIKLRRGLLFIALIPCLVFAAEKTKKPDTNAPLSADVQRAMEACRNEPFPLPRLQCYDQAWHPKMQNVGISLGKATTDKPDETWHLVMAQEHQRAADAPTLLLREFKNTSGEPVLMMTTPSQEGSPVSAILAISCVENITRMQLVFSQPLGDGESPLTLRTGKHDIDSRWFWRSSGYRLESSRGLSGIAEIQQLLGSAMLTIIADNKALNGLTFQLNNLQTTLQPLRKACHW